VSAKISLLTLYIETELFQKVKYSTRNYSCKQQ